METKYTIHFFRKRMYVWLCGCLSVCLHVCLRVCLCKCINYWVPACQQEGVFNLHSVWLYTSNKLSMHQTVLIWILFYLTNFTLGCQATPGPPGLTDPGGGTHNAISRLTRIIGRVTVGQPLVCVHGVTVVWWIQCRTAWTKGNALVTIFIMASSAAWCRRLFFK